MPIQNFEETMAEIAILNPIQKKMNEYYEADTPEQVVKELGVEFESLPETIELFPDYLLNDPEIVGYPDLDTQEEIYDWVENYLPYSSYSIKDLGCGRGDFYAYLNRDRYDGERNKLIDYVGMDSNPNMVNIAKQKYPNIQVLHNDFLDISIDTDYSVIIGTLNEDNGNDKWDNFNKTLIHCLSNTKKKIIFVLQANSYGFQGSVDYPIHELVERLDPNLKFIIDNSKLEDIYVLIVHIADLN